MNTAMPSSSETWREPEGSSRSGLPEELRDYHGRVRGIWNRFLVRRRLAEETFAESRQPERGLPVASARQAAGFIASLMRERMVLAVSVVLLNIITAVIAVVIPRFLGNLVDSILARPEDPMVVIWQTVWLVLGALVLQAVFGFLRLACGAIFGQAVLARAREYVVRTVLGLPLSRVESTSTGDLVTRVTRDVSQMGRVVSSAVPHFLVAVSTVIVTFVAVLVNSLVLAVPVVLSLVLLLLAVPGYLRDAPAGYITEGASYSQINSTLTESIEGARTVEAVGLDEHRIEQLKRDIAWSAETERYNMSLRNRLFLVMDFTFYLPLIGVAVVAALGYPSGLVSLGQITVAVLYSQQMIGPLDRLIQTTNQIQIGIAAATRLVGIAQVPADREVGQAEPVGQQIQAHDLRFAYREGRDVLYGIDLDLIPGERLAIVGPSGSGKSTLSRLIAGINAPRTGEVSVGGVNVMNLPLERLRTEVALVTQEHHVFVGTIRDNIVLAREDDATDQEVEDALDAVGAASWVRGLAKGMHTEVGSGNLSLTPAQAQQIALARLVIANPHTLLLDEATSLIDPRTARHLEGSMHTLLRGRTVVAIAHRLHTAHDADRIAVVLDGRIVELGSHDELIRLNGEYAALWRAWRS